MLLDFKLYCILRLSPHDFECASWRLYFPAACALGGVPFISYYIAFRRCPRRQPRQALSCPIQ